VAADLFEGDYLHGMVPILFAEDPEAAESAFTGDPATARKDVDRMQRLFFQPEHVSSAEALGVVRKPVIGKAEYLWRLANLEALSMGTCAPRTNHSPPTGAAAQAVLHAQPGTSAQASSQPGPSTKKPRLEAVSDSGTEISYLISKVLILHLHLKVK